MSDLVWLFCAIVVIFWAWGDGIKAWIADLVDKVRR
jgi:hypothetical protein